MQASEAKFRRLDPQEIIATVRVLRGRIEDRFPNSGLGHVVEELLRVAEDTVERTRWIQRAL